MIQPSLPRRGGDRLPARIDLADIAAAGAVHHAYKLYGRALVEGDETALHEFLTAAAELPKVYRYLVQDMATYAVISHAHRVLPDDRKGDGRHVLDVLLAGRALGYFPPVDPVAGLVLPGRPVWERIRAAGSDLILGVNEETGAPKGRALRQIMGPRRQVGAHAYVGLEGWQREVLAEPVAKALEGRDRNCALAAKVVEAALATIEKRWGALPAAELLERALPDERGRSRLDLFTVATTDRLARTAKRLAAEDRALIHEPEDDGTRWWERRRAEAGAERAEPPEEDGLFPAIAEALARADLTETVRGHLGRMLRAVYEWQGPKEPGNQDLAKALGLSLGRVKQLKVIARKALAGLSD